MIERRILIGLITSDEFIRKVSQIWDAKLIESSTVKKMARWCVLFYQKYNKAPKQAIEGIFYKALQNGLDEELAGEIETIILPGLSDEYENTEFDWKFLYDETLSYFNKRKLEILFLSGNNLIESEKTDEAIELINDFKLHMEQEQETTLILGSEESKKAIENTFDKQFENLIYYPGALGEMWNSQFIRGGFVALLAPEKRGKTFMLIDMAMRACKQGRKVAFFQAGDMTEAQQLRRICIYLAKQSDQEKYCTEHWQATKDCKYNQVGQCYNDTTRGVKECDEYLFDTETDKPRSLNELIEAAENHPYYEPCYNCHLWKEKGLGAPFIKRIKEKGTPHPPQGTPPVSPLGKEKAILKFGTFFSSRPNAFRLSTHSNGTLTVSKICNILKSWKEEGFEAEVIIIDYAELLEDTTQEYRHKQNKIWKGLRAISQDENALVITATQADANAYETNTLKLSNFSEDKRKYAHVTAFYGLNQDKEGKEKSLGILRINELLIREGEFDTNKHVKVIQDLKIGRPFLGSFF